MAFSFGFSGDDIDGDSDPEGLVEQLKQTTFDEVQEGQLRPKSHTLAELLESIPSQVSYNYIHIPAFSTSGPNFNDPATKSVQQHPGSCAEIPRRSLFDIRQQLMAESDPTSSTDGSLLAGLETGDLSSGIYEGGFKTWECAIDLAGLILSSDLVQHDRPLHVIELGAGSGIPSLVLLQKRLRTLETESNAENASPLRFTLCDYNEDVLRLCTAANVFLATCTKRQDTTPDERDLEFEDIDQTTTNSCLAQLQAANTSVSLLSGAWGNEFLELIGRCQDAEQTLVLASETIYSLASTKVFSKLLVDILRRDPARSKAWVAAKKVYFGVGGGVQDFTDEISRLGGDTRTVLDEKGSGVGRVVIEVTMRP